jgi:urea transport system permease protein
MTLQRLILPLAILLLLLLPIPGIVVADDSDLTEGLGLLIEKSFAKKTIGVEKIGASGDPRAEKILRGLLDGHLFLSKRDQVLVYAIPGKKGIDITNILTGKSLGVVKAAELGKITINNQLRSHLKALLARLSLTSPDPIVRLAGVKAMLADLTPDTVKVLQELQGSEKNGEVKEVLATALALSGIKSTDAAVRIDALANLQGNLNPVVRNELIFLIDLEKDGDVQDEARRTLASIEATIAWNARLETVFFGLSLGSVLVLAAIGLAITFGVIGVINMAHGELIMIGAYTAYVLQQLMPNSIGPAVALAVPAAFCVSGLVGIVIEKSVIRFLYGRPLETLLATFGISLILQQAVRSIFSPLNRSVSTPEWMSGSIVINPVLSLTSNRLTIFVFAMVVFAGLFILLKKSSLGLQVRAVSQNRAMARAMGVRASRVDALTFGLGSGIAGIAGVALSQLTNVGPNLGQSYIVDSFLVVVFGGVGNLWGTLLGGLSLGVANKFLEPYSGAVLAKIIILVLIILFIQKRPQGLFPQRGRAAE